MSYTPSVKRSRISGFQNHSPTQGVEDLYSEIKSFMAGQEVDCPKVDVFFAFGKDGKRVPAHKLILACGSEVLQSKFFRKGHSEFFCEETGDVPGDDDVTGDAFLEFLQFFYLSEVKLSIENIADVMKLVDYYQVNNGMDICCGFLKDNIMANGMIGLDLAFLYRQDELKKLYENHFIVNMDEVIKDGNFLKCSERVLEHILKITLLSCSEAELFKACMSWVETKSGQAVLTKEILEHHLNCFFSEIRFKSLTSEEFITLAESYESVLSADFRVINKMIVMRDFQPNGFNTNPRMQATWNDNAIINFNRVVSERTSPYDWEASSEEENTIFFTDQPLLLGGFFCENLFHVFEGDGSSLRRGLSVDVTITEMKRVGSSAKTLLETKICLESADNDVFLPKPILIRPGYHYTIRMPHLPESYCYPMAILRKEVRESDVTVRFLDLPSEHYSGAGGAFIRKLYFNKI